MDGIKGVKVAALTALMGAALAVLSACGGGSAISQSDYDAVKAQLATKEQEAVAAKQQLSAFQQQSQPAAPREPRRLEAKITIEMGEAPNSMFFANTQGVTGGPFTLPADKTVGIHFVNKGKKLHEFLFGRTVQTVGGKLDGYQLNLFERVAADLFVYYPLSGKMAMVEIGGAEFEEIEVDPGTEVWLRAKFPAELKGEWEIGCFVQEPGEKGHYDQGMHAKLIIQ